MGFAAKKFASENSTEEMMVSAAAARKEGVIDLALGDPDLDTDPRVIRAAFADAEAGHTHYAPAQGDADLCAAIRDSWTCDYGIKVAENELMVTTSGCHAMWLLLTAILDPEDEVVVFTPCFSPYFEQIGMAGGVAVEVPTFAENAFKPSASALEAALTTKTKAIIVNSPCNPTGTLLDNTDIASLLSICEQHDLLYIADDIYTAYAFNQPFIAAATLPLATGRVATIHSFSKDFCMSGWRVGYVVAPPEVIDAMLMANESNIYVAPTISQRAAHAALEFRSEIYTQVNNTYRTRMEYVRQRIASIEYLDLPTPYGGLYAFIDIRKSGESSSSFTRKLLAKHNVSVIAGSAFGASGEGFIRMALREDIPTLKKVFDTLEQESEWSASINA